MPSSKRQRIDSSDDDLPPPPKKRPPKGLSERRLKLYSALDAPGGLVRIHVGVSGARAGDLLRGIPDQSSGDCANVLLRVETGVIAAPAIIPRTLLDEVGREVMVKSVAKHFRCSEAAAELRFNDFPTTEAPNHTPLGSGCGHGVTEGCDCEPSAWFVILSQGIWQEFAEEHGHGAELQAMVSEQRAVCWKQVLSLMHTPGQLGGKTLILRPRLFEIVAGPLAVSEHDDRVLAGAFVCTKLSAQCTAGPWYELEGHVVQLPGTDNARFTSERVPQAVQAALAGVCPEATEVQVERCVGALCALTGGGLKSLLQKCVRLHAKTVDLEDGQPALPAPLVAAAAVASLFAQKGTFSPELQLFTRGCTAACKRLAVILLEDGWVPGPETPRAVLALTALALAMQRMPDYEPPVAVVVAAAELAARAALSPALIAWRKGDRADAMQPVDRAQAAALAQAAVLLRIVRSFGGDMDMFDSVAAMARSGTLALTQATEQPERMPIWHLVDQHAFRGVGHPLQRGNSFGARFKAVFSECTGLNPRQQSLRGMEQRPVVMDVRFAQRCCGLFALQRPRKQLARCSDAGCTLVLVLDPGVLAAGVGPVKTKLKCAGKNQELLVLLGTQHPEDEVVMLKPSRSTRDLFGELTDEQRARAIHMVRQMVLPVHSPLLPPGQHRAHFQEGRWHLDGVPWSQVVAEGRALVLPTVEPPSWLHNSTRGLALLAELQRLPVSVASLQATKAPKSVHRAAKLPGLRGAAKALEQHWRASVELELDSGEVPEGVCEAKLRELAHELQELLEAMKQDRGLQAVLDDNSAIEEALGVLGDGAVAAAEQHVMTLVAAADPGVALRAGSLLRQEWSKVAMPTPSLDGKLGSDQLAAYERDWDVWRLLVLVSRLVPAALAPGMPPNFAVNQPCVLRLVEQWVFAGARKAAQVAPGENLWRSSRKWQEAGECACSRLMEHQRAAVSRMQERDAQADTGHFLIMDTGLGKTVTSLVYAYRWLCEHAGSTVQHILWVTPAGTTDNLLRQLKQTWAVPVWQVPRISSAAKPKPGDARALQLKPLCINVVHADHLRTCIDKGLAAAALACFVVFDEVDEMYAPTLRTSAARRLAQLCPKFVAQTATPMRKNESQLRTWLADTCSFPVTPDNMLVAASGMVSIQLELGISGVEEQLLVPMSDPVRAACRELLNSRSWLAMARVVQEHTDAAMVQHAVKLARADREAHPQGGVLLVSDSQDHADKLIALCGQQVRTGGFSSLEAPNPGEYAVVVVTKQLDRGYNSAVRLGALVTGAYAGNGASRHQIRGRLRRIGQVRPRVSFVTVVMENSILELLHQRHSAVDSMNISLEQLGQSFSAEVLRGLERTP